MEVTTLESNYTLTKNKENTRQSLLKTLLDDSVTERVIVPNILPKFLTSQKKKIHVDFFRDFHG